MQTSIFYTLNERGEINAELSTGMKKVSVNYMRDEC